MFAVNDLVRIKKECAADDAAHKQIWTVTEVSQPLKRCMIKSYCPEISKNLHMVATFDMIELFGRKPGTRMIKYSVHFETIQFSTNKYPDARVAFTLAADHNDQIIAICDTFEEALAILPGVNISTYHVPPDIAVADVAFIKEAECELNDDGEWKFICGSNIYEFAFEALPYNDSEKDDEPFADALKAARNAAGLTQKAYAEYAAIPHRTIEDWESGRRVPPKYIQRLVLENIKRYTAE